MKKIYILLAVLFGLQFAAQAQSGMGTIRGTVKDKNSKKALDYVSITIKLNGVVKATALSDDDGMFVIKTLQPGEYDLYASFVGYKNAVITNINVAAEEDRFVNFSMEPSEGTTLEEVKVTFKRQLVDPGGVKGDTKTSKEIMALGTRSVDKIAGTTLGVESRNGGTPNFRGARADGTAYYIDGVRVTGGAINIPTNAIDQIQVITGGTPAQYGDFIGGAISMTTKAPTKTFIRGIEYSTSMPFTGYLDNSMYNNLQGFISGPVKTINKGRGKEERVVVGFLFSGSIIYAKSLAAVDLYKVKDAKLKELQATPLLPGAQQTLFPAAEFITKNDLEKVNTRQNVNGLNIDVNGNFNFQPTTNINVRLGYYGSYSEGNNWSSFHSLLNSANNAYQRNYTVRTYLQFTQSFKTENKDAKEETVKKKSNVSNAYYSVRFSYERSFGEAMDATHRDNLFDYGYIGKFTTYQAPNYTRVIKGLNDKADTFNTSNGTLYLTDYYRHTGYRDTLYTYEQDANYNEVRGNYTRAVYDYFGADNMNTLGTVRQVGGLINGDNPNGIYSNMFANVGAQQSGYSKSMGEAYNLYIQSEFTVTSRNNPKAKHEFQVGLNLEQRFNRSYGLSAASLWSMMRLYSNTQFSGLDSGLYSLQFDENGVFNDTVNFQRKINAQDQSNFDKNFRSKLIASGAVDAYGKPIDEYSFIDVNSYKPSDYSLDMFNASELLNNGNSIVSYSGYDHLGKLVRKRPSIDDFLNDPTKRLLPAYQPTYFAAWLQDKFVFKDLIVRVGVRLERFDANQSVLKDPFSMVPIYTVGEIRGTALGQGNEIPTTIGDDFIPYIDKDADQQTATDVFSKAKIIGYRNGNLWYDQNGNPISDPQQIARTAKTNRNVPVLKDPENPQLPTAASFTDYKPDLKLLPRIWFSFPISTTSQFFGTYDILAQRPGNNVGQIDDYYYLQNRLSNGAISNPDLKMTQVTDYEIGFRQQIGLDAALGITASYREFRNLIQLYRYAQAWPNDYTTYGNLDFSTVKSIGLEYTIRDIGNITITANYQLQFADGTGSNAQSANALIQVGLPSLRTLTPMDFDTRHTFKAIFDYHYKEGKDYNGPIVSGKKIFENAGFNLIFTSYSGRPYTQEMNPTPGGVQSGVVVRSPIKGTINGANLPPQFNLDLNVDKNFIVKKKKIDGSMTAYRFRVFLMVQNLLNTANVTSVYRYTGSAYNDGFLASPASQEQKEGATNQQSYIDLYNIRMVNPDRFALPRTTRLGVALYF
ncbi:MAG: TonB-dependent receptor [Bacteroidia bacterium]|nr:TonB-dependent receptor [Bacteroidia bacterium]MCF8427202.1 TonB-dependent receptor [Bacteroidia bacterium]MCF8445409.1 TonB-dependent receptor [Bacteroidia bacterium]